MGNDDLDFHEREKLAAGRRADEERDDIMSELAGRGTGRMKRLGDAPGTSVGDKKDREREERQSRSNLLALLSDPAYREIYDRVRKTIDDARTRTEEMLLAIADRMTAIDDRLHDMGPEGVGSEEYKKLQEERERLQAQEQAILDFQRDVLDDAQRQMEDENDALSPDELDAIGKRVEEGIDKLQSRQAPVSEHEAVAQPISKAELPDLTM